MGSECGDCHGRHSGHGVQSVSVTPIQDPQIKGDIDTGVKLQVRLSCDTFM